MVINEKVKSKASLRISSQITNVQEISDLLDFDSDSFTVKGSKAVPDDPKSYVFPSNMWRLESDVNESDSLELHIARIIEFIENREPAFNKLIETCTFDIFCGYFSNYPTGSISLPASLLERLTVIPIKLIFEFYIPNNYTTEQN